VHLSILSFNSVLPSLLLASAKKKSVENPRRREVELFYGESKAGVRELFLAFLCPAFLRL
jgi:hypothetical protein